MQWHSLTEFLAMGGYAVYVWGSVGACALAMVLEPLMVRSRHRRLVRSLQPLRRTGGADGSAAFRQTATETTR